MLKGTTFMLKGTSLHLFRGMLYLKAPVLNLLGGRGYLKAPVLNLLGGRGTSEVRRTTSEVPRGAKKRRSKRPSVKNLLKKCSLLLHHIFIEAHHPVDAKLVGKHSEVIAPKSFIHRHSHLSAG